MNCWIIIELLNYFKNYEFRGVKVIFGKKKHSGQ